MRKPLVWYAIANTGAFALVPLLTIALLIPVGYAGVRVGGSLQATAVYLGFSTGLVVPVFSVWWPLFVFKERVEGDGRELLYFLKPRGEGVTAIILALAYCALVIPLVLTARGDPSFELLGMLLVCARCVLLCSLVFATLFAVRSSPVALVVALAFQLGGMLPFERSLGSVSSACGLTGPTSMTCAVALGYVLCAVILIVYGEARSRTFDG